MTFQMQDRVQETTTSTGSGTLSLAGAMTGFRTFSSMCANGDTFYYGLQAVTGTSTPSGNWEIGIGTYNAGGNTLSRTTVLASSNGGATVSLTTGTTQVWINLPAALPANLPVSAKYFGVKGNTRIVNDGVTTSGSTAFSSASAAFAPADVGKHIDLATGLVRYSYGVPTADTAGNAVAVWANGFVGTSATPSVTGISKLTANYASSTTLTNLIGGIDGQSVKIVSTNGNCTIANNANIQTTTGANVVMTTGQVLTFTFDATLNKWCGG
ncbi:hypothetical protein J2785_006425 [Burkholderia ambifaria]|nr:hypothetical protein [Burkholderia ambifaria]MDR6503232.1 hypothetical protein [Burkholderia ambifaria]